MKIAGSVAMVTGANRGIGKALVEALQARGAAKIYAAARDPAKISSTGVVPVALDITNPKSAAAAAAQCGDLTLLINNAGIYKQAPFLAPTTIDDARAEMETNYFGTLIMCRAFAPVLRANGGGALVNILSTASWTSVPMQASYCGSKAAAWSLTNSLRYELNAQGTLVVGVHLGYADTDMVGHLDVPKSRPQDIAASTLNGIERGDEEVLADQRAHELKAMLLDNMRPIRASIQRQWDAFIAAYKAT